MHDLRTAIQRQIEKIQYKAVFVFNCGADCNLESNALTKVNRKQLEIVASDRKIVNFNPKTVTELLSGL